MHDALDTLLTPRQLEMIAMLADGKDYSQIGAAKFISPLTVRNTLYAARDRVGAENVIHLVALCVSRGLVFRSRTGFLPRVDERVVG